MIRKLSLVSVSSSRAAVSHSCSRPLPPNSLLWREAADTDLTKTIAESSPTRISCRYKNSPAAHWLPARCLTMPSHFYVLSASETTHYKPLTEHETVKLITCSRDCVTEDKSKSQTVEEEDAADGTRLSISAAPRGGDVTSCSIDRFLLGVALPSSRGRRWEKLQTWAGLILWFLWALFVLHVFEAYSRCSEAPEGLALFTNKWFIA